MAPPSPPLSPTPLPLSAPPPPPPPPSPPLQESGCVTCLRRVTCCHKLSPGERQVVYSGLVAWVGVALGLVLAYPALVLEAWTEERNVSLSLQETSWFRSVVYLGSIPGSMVGGVMLQLLGPRRLLLLLLPALALAWLLLPLATPHAPSLIALRALQGVLVAGSGLCVYVYPCEVVEARRRDVVGALPEAAFSLGFLLAYLLAAALHWSTVVLLVPPCLLLPTALGVALVPESPAWLLHRGRLEEARDVLGALRPAAFSVEKELLSLQLNDNKDNDCPLMLLRHPRFLLPVLASLTLVLLKESTGQMVLVLTLSRVLSGGAVGLSPLWGSVVVGAARVAGNLAGCCVLLRHFPRRAVLSRAALTAAAAMVILANYYASSGGHFWPQVTPFVFTVVFVACYGGGVGPVASLMVTELLPGPVRGLGSGLANALLCGTQFGLTFLAPATDQEFTVSCWGYGGGCLLLAGFALLLPETRRRPLEELEEYWRQTADQGLCRGCLPSRKSAAPPPPQPQTPALWVCSPHTSFPSSHSISFLPTTNVPLPFSALAPHKLTPHLPTSASLPNTFLYSHSSPALYPYTTTPSHNHTTLGPFPKTLSSDPKSPSPLLNLPPLHPHTASHTATTPSAPAPSAADPAVSAPWWVPGEGRQLPQGSVQS